MRVFLMQFTVLLVEVVLTVALEGEVPIVAGERRWKWLNVWSFIIFMYALIQLLSTVNEWCHVNLYIHFQQNYFSFVSEIFESYCVAFFISSMEQTVGLFHGWRCDSDMSQIHIMWHVFNHRSCSESKA